MASAESADQHRRLVRKVPLLARLGEADLAALASRGHERAFQARTTIFHEGDPGDALYIVVEGRVRISMLSEGGHEMTLGFIEAGECFGDLAILDGGPRTATAAAVDGTRTFVVTKDAFRGWLIERPTAAVALLETVSQRLRRTDQVLADLRFLDLPRRLARQLLQLAENPPHASPSRVRVIITQSELGSLLGVSRESVNKQLRAFQRDGLVSLSRGAVQIDDPVALGRLP